MIRQDITVAGLASRLQESRWRIAQRAIRLISGRGKSCDGQDGSVPRNGIRRIPLSRSIRNLGGSLTLPPLLQTVDRVWPGVEVDPVSHHRVSEQTCRTCFGIGRIIRAPPHPVDTTGTPSHQAVQPASPVRGAIGERHSRRPYSRLDIRLTAAERQEGKLAVARMLTERPWVVHGCIGILTDATGDRRFDTAWWYRFVKTFERGTTGYALVEVLSANSVRSQLNPGYPCFYSSHPRELAAVLANLSFFVSSDGDVMHLAIATGVPTVGIFKTTDPSRWGPFGGSNVSIDARTLAPEQVAHESLHAFRAAIGASQAEWSARDTQTDQHQP